VTLPLLKYEVLKDRLLPEVPQAIRIAATARIGELKLDDLAEVNDYPNGAYIFYESRTGDAPFYVGRASSRSFLGRIPSHFEQREEYWMNGLSKGLQKRRQLSTYPDAVKKALDCYVAFIGVYWKGSAASSIERKTLINTLELVLQEILKPELNGRSGTLTSDLTLEQAIAIRRPKPR
jgi:hypothetical protein